MNSKEVKLINSMKEYIINLQKIDDQDRLCIIIIICIIIKIIMY